MQTHMDVVFSTSIAHFGTKSLLCMVLVQIGYAVCYKPYMNPNELVCPECGVFARWANMTEECCKVLHGRPYRTFVTKEQLDIMDPPDIINLDDMVYVFTTMAIEYQDSNMRTADSCPNTAASAADGPSTASLQGTVSERTIKHCERFWNELAKDEKTMANIRSAYRPRGSAGSASAGPSETPCSTTTSMQGTASEETKEKSQKKRKQKKQWLCRSSWRTLALYCVSWCSLTCIVVTTGYQMLTCIIVTTGIDTMNSTSADDELKMLSSLFLIRKVSTIPSAFYQTATAVYTNPRPCCICLHVFVLPTFSLPLTSCRCSQMLSTLCESCAWLVPNSVPTSCSHISQKNYTLTTVTELRPK